MTNLFYLIFIISSLLFLACTPQQTQPEEASFFSTGHADIDRVRQDIKGIPTDSTNVQERLNTLKLWVRLLSYSGADLNPLREHHTQYILNGKAPEIYEAIEYEYQGMEEIHTQFAANPQQYLVDLERGEEAISEEVRDWPTLRGDEGQTGFTTQSGPVKGQLKWKFPAGHAWYSTPAFDDGKVYIGSPGVSYEAYCLDATTGEYVWKTQQKENQNQYRTPRVVSPTLIVGDQVIVRELGSGGNNRAAKHFVYIDKNTGKEVNEVYAGHIDYRVGYAPFDGNEEYLVFPHSIQEIGSGGDRASVEVVSFDSLVCVGTRDGERKWKHYMGEFYSEPLLAEDKVFAGNCEGVFKCLEAATGKVLWTSATGSPINTKATLAGNKIIVSNQSGQVMAFDANSGKQLWKTLLPTEERAFQLFSKAVVKDGAVYFGSADKNLYSLNMETGQKKWNLELDNWVRSAPIFTEDKLIVATCGGTAYGIEINSNSPNIAWEEKASSHGIYADLRQYQGGVYLSSSDLFLIKINPDNGKVQWKTSIFESVIDEEGNRTLADLVGGGPDYQAGTTIANGIAYFGSPRFVYAVDIEKGKEVWKFETRGQICGAPAVDNGKVFFGQQGGTSQFYCVDAKTGELLWKKDLGWIWASPNVKDGKVYMAAVAGTFYCADQQTGEIIWTYESNQGAYPAPSFKGDLVYFGSWNGKYYAFNKDTGKMVWEGDIEGHPDSGSTMVMGNRFYAQGFLAKYFFTLDPSNGEEVWRYPLNDEWCNASPVSDGKRLLFSTYYPWLHQAPFPSLTTCLDAETGELLYQLPFAGGLTGAVICNDLVFTASTTDSYMRAWDVATGNIRWQYRMGGRAEETCTSIYGDKAFVLSTDSYLYAFE